jgi:hypothetical protein
MNVIPLNFTLTCVTVLTVDTLDCTRPLRARLPSGRIASITINESRCLNNFDTTWLIRGSPGQRVNISLLDFKAAANNRHRSGSADDSRRFQLSDV